MADYKIGSNQNPTLDRQTSIASSLARAGSAFHEAVGVGWEEGQMVPEKVTAIHPDMTTTRKCLPASDLLSHGLS